MSIIKNAYIWMNRNMKIVALCWVAMCLPAMAIPGTIAGIIALAIAVFAVGDNSKWWREVEGISPPCEQ